LTINKIKLPFINARENPEKAYSEIDRELRHIQDQVEKSQLPSQQGQDKDLINIKKIITNSSILNGELITGTFTKTFLIENITFAHNLGRVPDAYIICGYTTSGGFVITDFPRLISKTSSDITIEVYGGLDTYTVTLWVF
jgi:hypothetical protein